MSIQIHAYEAMQKLCQNRELHKKIMKYGEYRILK